MCLNFKGLIGFLRVHTYTELGCSKNLNFLKKLFLNSESVKPSQILPSSNLGYIQVPSQIQPSLKIIKLHMSLFRSKLILKRNLIVQFLHQTYFKSLLELGANNNSMVLERSLPGLNEQLRSLRFV